MYLIPSTARNLIAARYDFGVRFFTPLRCVQNDMEWMLGMT